MEQHPSITRSGKIAGSENLSKRFSEFVETFAVTARPRTLRMRPNRNSLRKRDGKKRGEEEEEEEEEEEAEEEGEAAPHNSRITLAIALIRMGETRGTTRILRIFENVPSSNNPVVFRRVPENSRHRADPFRAVSILKMTLSSERIANNISFSRKQIASDTGGNYRRPGEARQQPSWKDTKKMIPATFPGRYRSRTHRRN